MTRTPPDEACVAARMTRRGLCRSALAGLGLPALMGCGAVAGLGPGPSSGAGGAGAALLLPLTGSAAEIGQNMARAASLVTQSSPDQAPAVMDTGDTADGAARAAQQALEAGARVLMGPLRADQTPAVLAVAGNVPVVTFSNDDTLGTQGAFVMGVTPAQSVSTLFSYARAQGVGRIALVARNSPLGTASSAAAARLAGAGGITLAGTLLREPSEADLLAALRQAGGGTLPDAVFLPDGGSTLGAFAAALKGSGVQLLGSVQWGIADVTANGNLEGAWFAAPPPDLFLPFADRFQAAFGVQPGVVAALGHDAALLAVGLGNARQMNRRGLTRAAGFTGVLGGFRFLGDGRCLRDLTVLGVSNGTIAALGEVSGT